MKYNMYCYRDTKANFGAPILEENESTAIRHFAYEINKSGSIMLFEPKDFDLYMVGEFDPEKGEITGCVPKFIVSGSSCLRGTK